ncbi:MAG: hypothetical protein E7623_07690 [Ruminococcaceae bacterium]|nr:hypothetical protein [Oscillospiraceae bacterium]
MLMHTITTDERHSDLNKIRLLYELIETEGILSPERKSLRTVYSILIIKEEEGDLEYSFHFDVSSSASRAKELISAMYNAKVTPCTSKEILCELL